MLRQRLKFYSAGDPDFIDSFWRLEGPWVWTSVPTFNGEHLNLASLLLTGDSSRNEGYR